MSELDDFQQVNGVELTVEQLQGLLNQIDLDILNLVRDGKLSAGAYAIGGAGGVRLDRASSLRTLLEARRMYQEVLQKQQLKSGQEVPAWLTTKAETMARGRHIDHEA